MDAEGLPRQDLGLRAAVGSCAAGTLVLGIFPSLILGFINAAAGAK